jgi:predicted ATPase/class 3 adenylate cyclase/regulation of enolase protein 1 (concanavalin A-like superfamily)
VALNELLRERPAALRQEILTPQDGGNRRVTVLYVDAGACDKDAGETAIGARSELAAKLAQEALDVLTAYDGRVDRILANAVLFAFGAPEPHENDPERAIRAAMVIRKAAERLKLPVSLSVNSGESYVGGGADTLVQDPSLVGEIVQAAIHLAEAGVPGQILIGESTYRQARRVFQFLGTSLPAEGDRKAQTGYVVEHSLDDVSGAGHLDRFRTQMVGRDAEMALLASAYEKMLASTGPIVTVTGLDGLGKTRLLSEFRAHAGASGSSSRTVLWLDGRGDRNGIQGPLTPLIGLFRDYFAWPVEESPAARADQLSASLAEFVASGLLTQERASEIAPALGELLSARFGDERDTRLAQADGDAMRTQMSAAACDFLAAVARKQPLALVLEDLGQVDRLSTEMIVGLMGGLAQSQALLALSFESADAGQGALLAQAARSCGGRHIEVALSPLAPEAIERAAQSLLSMAGLPAELAATVVARSEGSPWVAEEVIRWLGGPEIASGDAETAQPPHESVSIPDSVAEILRSRMGRLDTSLVPTLHTCAAIGSGIRQVLLEALAQHTGLEHLLSSLVDEGILRQSRVAPEAEFTFKQAAIRTALYEALAVEERSGLHAQIAQALGERPSAAKRENSEVIAYHSFHAGHLETAVEHIMIAGEKASRWGLPDQAARDYEAALEWMSSGDLARSHAPWVVDAGVGLGGILLASGKPAEAEARFAQAAGAARDAGLQPELRARLQAKWAEAVARQSNRADDAIRIANEGKDMIGAEAETVEMALLNNTLASVYASMQKFDQWHDLHEKNAALLKEIDYDPELRQAYTAIFYLHRQERHNHEALDWAHLFQQRCHDAGDFRGEAEAAYFGAELLRLTGDLRNANDRAQEAVQAAERLGDRKLLGAALSVLAELSLDMGDLGSVETVCDRLVADYTVGGQPTPAAAWPLQWSALGALCTGVFEEIDATLQRAARGNRDEARNQFQQALMTFLRYPPPVSLVVQNFTHVLSGLEETWSDPEQFRAFCRRLRSERSDVLGMAPLRTFNQWFLEQATVFDFPHLAWSDRFSGAMSSVWSWQDPMGDTPYTLGSGLEIRPPNGRDLRMLSPENISAPRLLRDTGGDFALQATCSPASRDKPGCGGLLIWIDQDNFLHLDRGSRGRREITFRGWIGNREYLIGRGRLASERAVLRFERVGKRINAFCSSDERNWLSIGHAELPVGNVQVGIYASGAIDRTIYHGAYAEGGAARFEVVQLWA